MAEYIEREALVSDLEFLARHQDGFRQSVILGVVHTIKCVPAADVVPVVHGRWKYYYKQGKAVCTNCSFERGVDDNFGRAVACPNCGARMDGE